MSKKEKENGFGSALRLRKELIDQIDAFIKDRGEEMGYHSRADFIDKSIREKLEKLKPRFEHVNTFEDHVKIVDYELKKIISIYFREGGDVWCDQDEKDHCIHIDYVLTLPIVQKALKEKDWIRKNSEMK